MNNKEENKEKPSISARLSNYDYARFTRALEKYDITPSDLIKLAIAKWLDDNIEDVQNDHTLKYVTKHDLEQILKERGL